MRAWVGVWNERERERGAQGTSVALMVFWKKRRKNWFWDTNRRKRQQEVLGVGRMVTEGRNRNKVPGETHIPRQL